MIPTNGTYWSTGIILTWADCLGVNRDREGWSATVKFLDDGFCSDDADSHAVSTEGELRTRYIVADGEQVPGLTAAVDAVIRDAKRLGIEFSDDPNLFYKGDGEDRNSPPPPGWRDTVKAEARRLGWRAPY